MAHAARQSAGYRRGVTVGDGGVRYRPAVAPPAPSWRDCARCHLPDVRAPHYVPASDDPLLEHVERAHRVCGRCAYEISAQREASGLYDRPDIHKEPRP